MNKKASLLHQIIIHLILIALIFGLFFLSTTGKVNSNNVKQQILEKQTALLIDSSMPGISLMISKINRYGTVNNIEIKEGKIFVYVDDLTISNGYPYFTKYNVSVGQNDYDYIIKIEEKKT